MASSPPACPRNPKSGTMARSSESSGDLRVSMKAMSPEASAGDLRVSMTATFTEASAGDLRESMTATSTEASAGGLRESKTATSTEVSAGDLRESMKATSPDARADDLSAGTMGKSPGATPILQAKRGECQMVEKRAGSEEGPKTTPSCKLREIRRSARLRKQPKRKPFSDLTNELVPSSGSFPSSSPDVTSTKGPSSVISNVAKSKKVQNLWPTSTLRGIPSDLDLVKDQTCSTPHPQQRPIGRDYKGKSLVVASSSDCTQLGRTTSMRLKLESARVDHLQSKSFSVPLRKPKKKPRIRVPEAIKKPVLPQDFVEKQKAYFAEIDAFELPEEVVSESELE